MGKRYSEINHYNNIPQQLFMFEIEEHQEPCATNKYPVLFPEIRKGQKEVLDLVRETSDNYLGLDLEFHNNRITIVGVANEDVAASCYWSQNVGKEIISVGLNSGVRYVGFSTIGAEKRELERFHESKLPLDMFEDCMVLFWMMNSDLCKLDQGKEKGEKGSLGFMNLWACSSIYTMLSQWKTCRGKTCFGPCPFHDALGYNAVDTWAAYKSFIEMRKQLYV